MSRGATVGQDELDALLAEATRARVRRALNKLCGIFEAAEEDAAVTLSGAARVARAALLLEELTDCTAAANKDWAPLLERIATAHLLASRNLTLLATSIPPLSLAPPVGRCLLAVSRELLHVVETSVAPGEGIEARISASLAHGILTLLVVTSPDTCAVPGAGGAEALARATRLAAACGGAVRRSYEGGRLAVYAGFGPEGTR